MSLDHGTEAHPEAANPFRELLGVRMTDSGPGTATVVIDPVLPPLLQARGIVHGGVYATLVDCAAGEALRTAMGPGQDGFTVDLNITYLRPVDSGPLRAHGRVLTCGRTTAVAVADIYNGADDLVASGRATFALRPRGWSTRGKSATDPGRPETD
jgi:acyl-CoA thioesterase